VVLERDAPGRLIRGGAWDDNSYEFRNSRQAPAMDRSARNGIRLAYYPDLEALPPAAFRFESLQRSQGLPRGTAGLGGHLPCLQGAIRLRRHRSERPGGVPGGSPGGWIREKVSFDAAYGGEQVLAYLFLPGNTAPPYQTVIYFPGAASTWLSSSEEIESYYEFPMFLSFLVRNGRAVLYPVYKGTFERVVPGQIWVSETHQWTESLTQLVKDFRRSIDYLETRPDIDSRKLAYYGMSWGSWLGGIIPAVEERLAASVLLGGGFFSPRARPEAARSTT
jgi:eukaryotic-like serine/threonine-protein kinase